MSENKNPKKVVVDGAEAPPIPKMVVPFYINWQSVARRIQEKKLKDMLDEIPAEKIIK